MFSVQGALAQASEAKMTSVEKVEIMALCCKVDYFCHISSFNSS